MNSRGNNDAAEREGCGCGCTSLRSTESVNGRGRCGCDGDMARNDQPIVYSSECHAMMHQLQMLDFSIQETVLYLDAYPECEEALRYYRQLLATRKAVAAKYEANCGPISCTGNLSDRAWDWGKAPWPWYPDFPGNKKG